jgi:glycosyltransferase involved in cell wall biosynthesis
LRLVHYLPRILLAEGGLVRAVYDLSLAMARRGHEVTVLSYDVADAPAEWRRGEAGFPRVVRLDWPRLPRQILSWRALKAASKWLERADVVHCHGPFMFGSVQIANLARRVARPYVYTVHGMLDDWSMSTGAVRKRAFLALGIRRCLERAARVLCTADAELEQAKKWFPRGRGVVLPYLVDTSPFVELPGPGAARRAFAPLQAPVPRVLFMSRLHPKKGLEILLRAMKRMRETGPPVRLVIAGAGDAAYTASLHALTRDLDITDWVDFLGMVSGALKVSLIEACDVFALPTSQENFGLALIEAMACGLTVVTTRGVDIWRELEKAGARVVDPSNESFASALIELFAQPEALVERGLGGRRWVMAEFDPQRSVERYEALYREVAAEMPKRVTGG